MAKHNQFPVAIHPEVAQIEVNLNPSFLLNLLKYLHINKLCREEIEVELRNDWINLM